jgi:hypothetical protein
MFWLGVLSGTILSSIPASSSTLPLVTENHEELELLRLTPPPAPPNHGPGTSGGGSSVLSGETLKQGQWSLSFRSDFTEYESIDREEAEERAIESGEFDAIERSFVESISLEYGLTDDVELGLETGYYLGSGFIDAEADGFGGAESATADPEGFTDLWIRSKWRVMRGPEGHLALLAGVKLPTGDDDDKLSNGEKLEPSSQPGTGAVDWEAGVGYSRFLTPRVTLDASGAYTFRGKDDGFVVGDRADLGVALAYRLTEDVKAPNNWSVFGEALGIWIGEDEADGGTNENSGGTTVYLSGGIRDRLSEHAALSLAPAIPVVQDLNGEQAEAEWKLTLTLSLSW